MDIIFYGDSLTKGNIGVSFFEILQKKLPNHNLVNRGRNGDTVTSLLRRIKRRHEDKEYDIAFLWIGTNDVLSCVSTLHKATKMVCRQLWTEQVEEFNQQYRKALEITMRNAKKVYTVTPLLIDEDIENNWNIKLKILSTEIREISEDFESVEFIDIQKEFFKYLSEREAFEHRIKKRDLLLPLFLHKDNEYDNLSAKRGFFLTFDGVHLNSVGANIVAEIFYKKISEGRI